MAAEEKIIARMAQMFDRADAKFKDEEIQARCDTLARYYDHRTGNTLDGVSNPYMIHVNKVYPRVRLAMASMFAKRPEILTRPRRAESVESAKTAEIMLNYLTRYLSWSKELREVLWQARLFPYGVMKFGMSGDKTRLPSMTAHDPRAFRADPSSDRFRPEEWRWVAFRFRRSVAQLRASGLYKEADLDKLCETLMASLQEGFSEETTEVWLWEHYLKGYDGNPKNVYVATAASGMQDQSFSSDNTVWVRKEPFTNVIGLPVELLYFVPSPAKWYPVSPIELWLDQQLEVDVFRTQKLLQAQRSNVKMLYDMNAISEGEREKLSSSEPMEYIGVDSPNSDPSKAVSALKLPDINPSIYAGEMEADSSIMEIDGAGTAQLGMTAPKTGSTSATRDAIIQQNMQLRSGDNQEVWEEFLENCYKKDLKMAQSHMKGELWAWVTGMSEVRMSQDEIQGDMDTILAFGSTMPRDRELEYNKAKELMEMFRGDPDIDQRKLKKYVLNAQGDIKDVDQWFLPLPPPMMPQPGLSGAPIANGGGPMAGPEGMPEEIPPQLMAQMQAEGMAQEGASPLSMAAGMRGQVQ